MGAWDDWKLARTAESSQIGVVQEGSMVMGVCI
jgi:hypothetical protein